MSDKQKEISTLEEFDQEIYARTSDNNMPMPGKYEPLTEDEKKELDQALSLK